MRLKKQCSQTLPLVKSIVPDLRLPPNLAPIPALPMVLQREVLTPPGEPGKPLLNIKLSEEMTYVISDYLAVLPLTRDESVRGVLKRFSIPGNAAITIKDSSPVDLLADKPVPASDHLEGSVEISQPATTKVRLTWLTTIKLNKYSKYANMH